VTSERGLPAGTVTFLVADDSVEVFATATEAISAAAAQRADGAAAPRVALTTGDGQIGPDGQYRGPALDRGVRLRDVAEPGQVLVCDVTASLAAQAVPEGQRLADLGVHRLHVLAQPERIFELVDMRIGPVMPGLLTLDVEPNNLPVQLTTFVGRRDELSSIADLISSSRLLTLTGPPGCGKTRLAAQTAAEQIERWPNGAWWVDLCAVTDAASVAGQVAAATGVLVEPRAGALRALTVHLRDRRLLVCLDNCEQVLDGAAEVVETLLRACPDVSVLATSREPLGVSGEVVWRVPPISDGEALALFVERASRVRPWLALDAANESVVRSICRELDGIPLAIELAAAWMGTLTPSQIAARLDARLALLVRGPRRAVPRQQTMAAAIEWSHDLLREPARGVFRRLAVFAGGFTLDAACAVCSSDDIDAASMFDLVADLVEKSLVVADELDRDGRYRLLETIRQYALDRLADAGEEHDVRIRHFDYFTRIAEAADHDVVHVDEDDALRRLSAEHDNLRSALEWAFAAGDPDRPRRLSAAMIHLWRLGGHPVEGLRYLRAALDLMPDDRTSRQAQLLCGVAAVAVPGGQVAVIAEAAERAYAVASECRDDTYAARALFLLAFVQAFVDFDRSWTLCLDAREHANRAHDPLVTDGAKIAQGILLSHRDRFADARPLLRDGYEGCVRRGNRYFAALALNYLDDEALLTGQIGLACELAEEALAVAEPLADFQCVGQALAHLALARGYAGDIEGARRLLDPIVRSIDDADYRTYVPRLVPTLGKLHLWAADYEVALAWFERDVRYADPISPSQIVARSLPGLAAALRQLRRDDEANERAEQAIAAARHLEMWHVVADALEQAAHLAARDDTGTAENLHHEALALRVEHGLRTAYVDSLDALAALAIDAESLPEAARIYAASSVARDAISYPRRPADEPEYGAAVHRLRSALGERTFATVWAEGATLTLDDAVAYVRRARGARGRPTSGWDSLTPAELDVVRLAAEGLTNPEIGQRLFMSRGTVKTHLAHVFAKVGVANRTELATMAQARLQRNAPRRTPDHPGTTGP
jgi:predicted ATPase/DNA-binding CsgD family transcriptional regulator/tetratricopeptide (TPR) repeat protein